MVVIRSQGQIIFGNFSLPRERAPCVILSHGLESSKDSDKWLLLSSQLCDAGFASLRFNYRGCGEGEEKSEGEFEDTSLAGRISDYRAAIDYLQTVRIDTKRLGAIGSSFGGMVALAAKDKRIKAMVTLATPYLLPSPSEDALEHAKDQGYLELNSGRRLRLGFYQDLRRYNILTEIKKIRCPLLIIHGGKDEIVPVEHAHVLYRHANEPKRLEIIDGANHVFDNPKHLDIVVRLSLEWFKTYP